MFINISNHPSQRWCDDQRAAAEVFGEIVDLGFPNIDADEATGQVSARAEALCQEIVQHYVANRDVVHVMGEMTFTYALVRRLQAQGFTCLASTTSRIKQMLPDGTFLSEFRFKTFRDYE